MFFAQSARAVRKMSEKAPVDASAVEKISGKPALDAFDLRILAAHQSDTRVSAEAIGLDIGLSTAAVHRRLKRLREEGVIEAEVAVLSAAALGHPLTLVVSVDIEREGLVEIDRFKARMRALPQVQQCYYVTGEADFMLVVVSPDLATYERFTRAHLLSDPNVKRFTTNAVLEPVKRGYAVPIDVGTRGAKR